MGNVAMVTITGEAMAADDKRNFRSYYYEKFGFRGVEEKKSIEIILNEKHIDIEKLAQFCLRFPVPAMHRSLVWKMLLEVLPPYSDTHDFIISQRKEQYDDLARCLRITRRVNDNTSRAEVFLKMFMLEESKFKLEEEDPCLDPENQDFLAIALAMENVFKEEMKKEYEKQDIFKEMYWLTKNFVKVLRKLRDNCNSLKESFCLHLSQTEPRLYQHLQFLEAMSFIPLTQWINRCYAGTLHESSLGKIWDKVIGGSSKILIFVGIAILSTSQRSLLGCQKPQDIIRYISGLSEDASDVVVTQAVEMWSKHGEIGRIKSS